MKNAAEDAHEARIAAGEAAEAEEQRKLRACLEDEYASERAAWDCIRCGLPVSPEAYVTSLLESLADAQREIAELRAQRDRLVATLLAEVRGG